MAWCINNGIRIYPSVADLFHYRLTVEKYNGKKWIATQGTKLYLIKAKQRDEKWYTAVMDLYEHYYKMANNEAYRLKHLQKTKTNITVKP